MEDNPQVAAHESQDPAQISQLVAVLNDHVDKGRAQYNISVRKATFELSNGQKVDSWRMQDWDYKKEGLPTYARGLFTCKNRQTNADEIVVRGYDKFFNLGEVAKTAWKTVKQNTHGPYELSVKENGCIIFIGAVDDKTMIVCSKHSTGARKDVKTSHAVAGERWLEQQLQAIGRSKVELARTLRQKNITAVAELCDDAFEEHVLAYGSDIAGLYLHGINLNQPKFATYPHHLVDQFAEEWGFRKVRHIIKQDVNSVKTFLDDIAESGAYEGRDTEGFVIRCQAREHTPDDWHDWFFKYKFEEPYLMYRQWRECTKAMIEDKEVRYKKHQKITQEYLVFARKFLAADAHLKTAYLENHGIIRLRDAFLEHKGVTGGEVIQSELESARSGQVTRNVLLVPIATLGCGKTTLGFALAKLFGWAHFQNDDIESKNRRSERFVDQCTQLLAQHPVVYADRNNHEKRERAQFIGHVSNIVPQATFVALHWVHERDSMEEIRQKLQDRVLSRGDNHQTIRTSKGIRMVTGIMNGFLARFQPVEHDHAPDSGFDYVIELNPLSSTRDNLETVISKLHEAYQGLFPQDMPSALDLDDAIRRAMEDYRPELKHDLSWTRNEKNNTSHKVDKSGDNEPDRQNPAPLPTQKQPEPLKVEYFGVHVSATRIQAILSATFKDLPAERAKMYTQLCRTNRLQSKFHVTLIHRSAEKSHAKVWNGLMKLHNSKLAHDPEEREPTLGSCGVLLERVIWDDRLMCFVVRLINETNGRQWETINEIAHITCGTASPAIKPKESNDLLLRWVSGGSAAENIMEDKVTGHVVLDGTVRAVFKNLQRTSWRSNAEGTY